MRRMIKPDGCVIAAFGPTWFHPLGGHLFSVFPWAHLIFTERALIRWRSDFKTDGATRFQAFRKVALPLAGMLALVVWFIHYRYTGSVSPRGLTASSITGLVMNAVFGYLIGAAAYMGWLFLHWRRIRKRWVACLNCGYSLRRLPRRGRCPECGCSYDRRATAAYWSELFAFFRFLEPLRW
jgi:hypothetical protein